MPAIVQPSAVVCEAAWEVTWRDGLFYASNPVLNGLEIAMRPNTLLVSFQHTAKAIQEYCGADTDAAVIPFKAIG